MTDLNQKNFQKSIFNRIFAENLEPYGLNIKIIKELTFFFYLIGLEV